MLLLPRLHRHAAPPCERTPLDVAMTTASVAPAASSSSTAEAIAEGNF
jgi:hypothetical protein